jgi:salicylate hydroxylase
MTQGGAVAIVGAGIAGLTTALCLARKGIASDILEQTSVLSETGAGLQLSPNATRILGALGLTPQLEQVWCEPAESLPCVFHSISFDVDATHAPTNHK